MDRRQFVKLAILGGAGLTPLGRSGWAYAGAAPANGRRLVVVFLRGAVDGLNVVVPHGDGAYYEARPSIAVARPGAADGAVDLDGYFGLHPALAALRPLYAAGRLAFVHASGSPDPTRSHFDAQDFMESGTPGVAATPDGWLNRLLQALPGPRPPTRGVSFGATMPKIFSGRQSVASMPLGRGAGRPTPLDRPEIGDVYARMYGGSDPLSLAFRESRMARRELMDGLRQAEAVEAEMKAANRGAPLPYGFPDDAARLARLLRQDPNIQLAFLDLGGWDTHIRQGAGAGQLAGRLKPLGDGLAAFARELGPQLDDTVVVVMSEFGRTFRENGDGGTDHGHGNVMWIMGGGVAGGKVHGHWPGLDGAHLYQNRDLAVTTDFRSVLLPVVERHLRLPDWQLAQVFPRLPGGLRPLDGLFRA